MSQPPPVERRTLLDWLLLAAGIALWVVMMRVLSSYYGVPVK